MVYFLTNELGIIRSNICKSTKIGPIGSSVLPCLFSFSVFYSYDMEFRKSIGYFSVELPLLDKAVRTTIATPHSASTAIGTRTLFGAHSTSI